MEASVRQRYRVDDATAGDLDRVGTPGQLPKSPSDIGTCEDGAGEGVNVPSPLFGSHCRAGI